MTSWHENAFCISVPLWPESTDHWWITFTQKANIAGSYGFIYIYIYIWMTGQAVNSISSCRWLKTPWKSCDNIVMHIPTCLCALFFFYVVNTSSADLQKNMWRRWSCKNWIINFATDIDMADADGINPVQAQCRPVALACLQDYGYVTPYSSDYWYIIHNVKRWTHVSHEISESYIIK